MVTLKDIARETGFSLSVVSRVLNPKPDKNARVAPKTSQLINEVAKKLNYKPNHFAKSFQKKQSPAIGVFLPDIGNRLIADLMFGISEKAEELGFPVSFFFGKSKAQYEKFIANNVDVAHSGIITYPDLAISGNAEGLLKKYQENGGSLVVLNQQRDLGDIPVIKFDEKGSGKIVAKHLLKRGCKKFLTVAPAASRSRFDKSILNLRSEGFIDFLKENKQKAEAFEFKDVNPILEQLKEKNEWPVGLFAITDLNAMKLITAARAHSLKIGEELFVIGYDDLYGMDCFDPPLTTVQQPFRKQGRVAAEKIIAGINGEKVVGKVLKPKLIVRASG